MDMAFNSEMYDVCKAASVDRNGVIVKVMRGSKIVFEKSGWKK